MRKCALLSIANTNGWFIDDDLVHEPLKALGWEVENVPWDEAVHWNAFDVVVIRSPWDYQDHLKRFVEVLEAINQSRARLVNSLDTVKWNIDKCYLFELEQKGIEIVPTIQHDALNESKIEMASRGFDSNELVVKPTIGANADDTFRINVKDSGSMKQPISIFKDRVCLVQPFMPGIVQEGEFSLMYFNGRLSHTILKTAKEGDYRIQEEHGGGVIAIKSPEKGLISVGDRVMNTLNKSPLYARVDLVRTANNSFALMELELIEPCLYFRFDPDSPEAFAKCIDDL
ncbi:MAG: hypothetical protein RLO17_09160 [Cyclobacteriaceae bacterium]